MSLWERTCLGTQGTFHSGGSLRHKDTGTSVCNLKNEDRARKLELTKELRLCMEHYTNPRKTIIKRRVAINLGGNSGNYREF